MPFFIIESISDIYKTRKPIREKEIVKAKKMHGIGAKNSDFWTQFTGTYFTGYNFYNDIIHVVDKDFHSPISHSWWSYYDYYLMDSSYVNEKKVYRIEIEPKRKYDLAFTGTIWVYDQSYALQKIDLHLLKTANLNYINNIYIKMDWLPSDSSRFALNSSLLIFDMSEISKSWSGVSGKIYNKFSKIKYEAPTNDKFYRATTEVTYDAQDKDSTYWRANSPQENLFANDKEAIALVNSVKELPSVKSYINILEFIFEGHQKVGKVSIGPYIDTYAYNEVEGHRFRLGGKTNKDFSKNIQFTGYGAYGTKDNKWKYSLKGQYYLSKKRWTYVGFKTENDLNQLGLSSSSASALFNTLRRWGRQKGAYYKNENQLYFFRQLNKNFATNIKVSSYTMNPLFDFSYQKEGATHSNINATEVTVGLHFGLNEKFILGDFKRLSTGSKAPLVDFSYTSGLKDVLGSDFAYHKLKLKIQQKFSFGNLGKSSFKLEGGKVFNPIPFPLLNVSLGNETFISTSFSFNMMNYFEFVSDQYASILFEHHFNGYLLNRLPLMRKLKWRTVASFNALQGELSQENKGLITDEQQSFTTFSNKPYMEVSYGIENIFKVLRIQVFHRLSYLASPQANKIAIKGALQFTF